jgi:hypothetical protein
VRSGDRGGQRPRSTMSAPNNSCSKAIVVLTVLVKRCEASCLPSPSDARQDSYRKHLLRPETVLSVGVLLFIFIYL